MIKTILVPSFGDEADIATFAAALAVARTCNAHLDVLHVRLDAAGVAMAMATDAGSGALTAGLIDRLEDDANERQAKAAAIFRRFCDVSGLPVMAKPDGGADRPTAEWHVETGAEPQWIATYGVAADLIVAARERGDTGVLARSILEAALLDTGRPLLIPAASALPASIDRIAIAWKPVPQAARAVTAAAPLIARAKEVVVLTVEEGSDDKTGETDRLLRNLAWHGVAVRKERLSSGPDGAAATLLDAAATREHADLLVMGGYGHNRVREWVFGGVTQQVLGDAPLPVLIAH